MSSNINTLSEFHKVNPIEFKLWDKDMLELLPITDNPNGYPLTLKIKNTSASDIEIPEDGEFELRFRPNTLSQVCKNNLKRFYSNKWELTHQENNDHTDSIIFKSKEAQIFKVGDENSIKISLNNMSAEASGGARGARVELRYQKLHFSEKEDELNGYRTTHMNIVKLIGQSVTPFRIGFISENTVLNNGDKHTLYLRVANQYDKPITINENSKFVLSFESGNSSVFWALARKYELNNVSVKAIDTYNLEVTKDEQATEPTWEIRTNKSIELKKGDGLTIEFSNIKTTHPAGVANLYIRYHNIDGFQDGYETLEIKKVSIPLLQKGIIMMWSGSSANIPKGWVLCDGTNGTPDLTDKFIVGAGRNYSVKEKGERESVTLTTNNIPSHSHSCTISQHNGHIHKTQVDRTHGFPQRRVTAIEGIGDINSFYSLYVYKERASSYKSDKIMMEEDGKHSHTATIQNTGENKPFNIIPPYYALCFIMYVGGNGYI